MLIKELQSFVLDVKVPQVKMIEIKEDKDLSMEELDVNMSKEDEELKRVTLRYVEEEQEDEEFT